jgi:predicted MFS family arabinose efflux permease
MPISALAAIVISSIAAMPGNVLPVLGGLLADFRALDEASLGLVVASGTFAGLVTSLTAPQWVGRVNLRRAAGIALFVAAIGLLGLRFAPGMGLLFVAQALCGASNVVIASSCLTVIAKLPNPTRAYSIKLTADVTFAGAFLALIPFAHVGLAGFVAVLAAVGITAAPLAMRLPQRADAEFRVDGAPVRLRDAPATAWLTLAMVVVFYIGGLGVWAFLERLAVHEGITHTTASNAIAAGLFVGVAGSLSAAVFAGRGHTRIWPETVSGFVLVASFLMLKYFDDAFEFYVAVFIFNATWSFFIPFVVGLIARRDRSGRMASLVPGTVMIGGILGPMLFGGLVGALGYDVAMTTMTAIVAASIFAYVAIARTRHVVQNDSL